MWSGTDVVGGIEQRLEFRRGENLAWEGASTYYANGGHSGSRYIDLRRV